MNYPIRFIARRFQSMRCFLLIHYAIVLFCSPNLGATVLLDITGAGSTPSDSSGNTFGWSFTVGPENISIAALGVWDMDGDGLNNAHDVGLWNSTGTLLASTTIYSGINSTLYKGFRYENLNDTIHLKANNTYFIGALYPSGGSDPVHMEGAYSFDAVTYVQNQHSAGNALSFPSQSIGVYKGFIGPNASMTPVPESGTAGVFVGLGVVLYILWHYKFSQ